MLNSAYLFYLRELNFSRFSFLPPGKRAACFALGGFLKGDESNIGKYTLLNCEIKLCSGRYCNTRNGPWPKLSPSAITVFTPTGKLDIFG